MPDKEIEELDAAVRAAKRRVGPEIGLGIILGLAIAAVIMSSEELLAAALIVGSAMLLYESFNSDSSSE